ncbi:hypothetical protein BUALT_Bualt08G0038700 [Buddleja alternifolia]|uniref:Integrase catalytic domain-containing protein n=1 Tax=Buddleja alternifolia TaxID=168488 RepID=A0AAV6XBG7_9LAMI|nr:hypothetical protein BUALT_Bualt08G0038700 [Buddleja alternifolia]
MLPHSPRWTPEELERSSCALNGVVEQPLLRRKGKKHVNSLPDSWDTLVVSVSNSAPNGDLTLQVVKDCLLNEQSRRKEQAFSTEQNALVTENSDRRGRNKSRGPQHQRDKSRGKSKFKGDFKCHYCGGPNHYERDCKKKKRDQKNGNNENKKDDKDTTAVATDGDVVIICDDACVSSSCQETDWIIDSGASYHITPHRDMFTSYTSGNFGRVRMANHGVTEVIGMKNINLETDTGCRLILRDVRHIPDIRLNIISTGKLDDDGYVSNFGEGKWKLTKGSLITAKGKKKNSLYLMQAKLSNGEVNAAVNNSSIELWHKRLGHLSQKGMQLLAKKKLLPDVSGIELQTCVDCLAGKQHRVAFKSFYPSRKSHPLDLVHTNVCYKKDKTLGGVVYFVTFIDDFSRKVWCFALKSKDQGPFEQHCRDHGIRLEKSVPKTPQHNGVAERMNRTICEGIKCMLSHSKLPKSFWGEAMRTAVDLINLSPSAPLDGDIPDRVWSGKDVSYKHLRVFGCRAFVHIPKDERSKLDDKTKPCTFLGYGHEEFGYRLWDPVNKKVIRSRDVVFLEEQTSDDIKQS